MSVGEWDEVGARVVHIGSNLGNTEPHCYGRRMWTWFGNYGNIPTIQWPLTQSGTNSLAALPVYSYDTEDSTLDAH